jgi:hypothetical protein
MESKRHEYNDHTIELRGGEGRVELIIDDIPVRYRRRPDGLYILDDYAYDPTDELVELAQKFIDYRITAARIRLDVAQKGGQ